MTDASHRPGLGHRPWLGDLLLGLASLTGWGALAWTFARVARDPNVAFFATWSLWPFQALGFVLPAAWIFLWRRRLMRPKSARERALRRLTLLLHLPTWGMATLALAFAAVVHRPGPLARLDGPDNAAARAGFRILAGFEAPPEVVGILYRSSAKPLAFLRCRGVTPQRVEEIAASKNLSLRPACLPLRPESDALAIAYAPSWMPLAELETFDRHYAAPHDQRRLWYRESDGTLVWLGSQ